MDEKAHIYIKRVTERTRDQDCVLERGHVSPDKRFKVSFEHRQLCRQHAISQNSFRRGDNKNVTMQPLFPLAKRHGYEKEESKVRRRKSSAFPRHFNNTQIDHSKRKTRFFVGLSTFQSKWKETNKSAESTALD